MTLEEGFPELAQDISLVEPLETHDGRPRQVVTAEACAVDAIPGSHLAWRVRGRDDSARMRARWPRSDAVPLRFGANASLCAFKVMCDRLDCHIPTQLLVWLEAVHGPAPPDQADEAVHVVGADGECRGRPGPDDAQIRVRRSRQGVEGSLHERRGLFVDARRGYVPVKRRISAIDDGLHQGPISLTRTEASDGSEEVAGPKTRIPHHLPECGPDLLSQ